MPRFRLYLMGLSAFLSVSHGYLQNMSKLKNAGVFDVIKGVVFGRCSGGRICSKRQGTLNGAGWAWSVADIVKSYCAPRKLACFTGMSFGVGEGGNPVLPIGGNVEFDANGAYFFSIF
jgi:muramoyltetrapeptide carboxypeptidase LdcA involved in peptidoglycan recycling